MDSRIVTMHSLTQLIDRMYPAKITKQNITEMLHMLKKHRKISLKEIADMILYIADTSHREWNIEVILNSINDVFESINWRSVYEKFIEEDLKVWNTEYLYTLVDCWVHVSGIITVPYEVFFRMWQNRENQIDFFRILLESDERRTQVYSNIFFEKIVTKEEIHSSKFKKPIEYESNLNSVELFKSIRDIDAVETIELIKDMSKEYCILGLAAVQPFCQDVFDELFVFFCESTTSSFVYHILFTKYGADMLHTFKRVSKRVSLTRTLDIFLEHKMLPIVSELLEPKDLCFDIIVLSSRRDHLNIEVWLSNNFSHCSGCFVDYIHTKMLRPATSDDQADDKGESTDNESPTRSMVLKSDTEMFPLDIPIINSIIKIISEPDLSEDLVVKLNEIKKHISESKVFDKSATSDRAAQFISEIINSHVEVEESIFKLQELIRGDDATLGFAKSVLGLLIDNYSNLYKLPNSDMLAVFFGELIKRRIFLKPFMNVALQLIKKSLSFPQSDREYAFAFRTLEVFLIDNPDFFAEIEGVEIVCAGLIRKEMILIDEDSQAQTTLDTMLDIAFGSETLSEVVAADEKIWHEKLRQKSIKGGLKGPSTNVGTYLSRFYDGGVISSFRDIRSQKAEAESGSKGSGEVVPRAKLLAFYMLKTLPEAHEVYVGLVGAEGREFKDYIVEIGFSVLKNCFIYKMKEELDYYRRLGAFLGALVIAQNRMVSLELFDFRNFILKSIEYRRITICVYTVASFLKEGRKGIVFVPNNPWLMSILDLLAELHSCTLAHIRQAIRELFEHFGLKITPKPAYRMKEHLIKYTVSFDGILKQVISSALDFSVREICNKVVRTALGISKVTATRIFSRILRDSPCKRNDERANLLGDPSGFFTCGSKNFFIFRNLFVNLTRALIHISAQEPLKASICGNVTHFLKLSMNELQPDEVYRIAEANLKTCCSFIEKVGVTQVNEIALELYESMVRDVAKMASEVGVSSGRIVEGLSLKNAPRQIDLINNLKIINEASFVEKTHVRSIENSEYQDIRTFLIQIGRKMPMKKKDFIMDEWPLLLGEYRDEHFKRMLAFLETAPDRDSQCMSLCKYLVGHAIKSNCKENFVFEFIVQVLEISPKTKREVVGWLIYSDDCKRHNIPLIKKFIEYDLIYMDEFDQALARSVANDDYKTLNFTLDLLTILVLGPIQLCTVYDFIHTIETLNKMNDNPRVFEFFRRIEHGMMKFTDAVDPSFDNALSTLRLDVSPEELGNAFHRKYNLNIKVALKSAWHHFVLYKGSFRFFKLDMLVRISRSSVHELLKNGMELLVQAYAKRHYLFSMFFCRLFVKILDGIEDTLDNRILISKALDILSPMSLPSFAAQYLEILDHKFIQKYLAQPDGYYIFKELVTLATVNPRYETLVLQFFEKNNAHSKKYNVYLSYICPDSMPNLKNLFNASRAACQIEKGTNPFFLATYGLSKNLKPGADYLSLIDNLNEHSSATMQALDRLRTALDKSSEKEEIVMMLLLRSTAQNPPQGIVLACKELFTKPAIKEIADRLTAKYFSNHRK